jgi:DNA-binding transcriptional LysR family regulator
VSQSALSHTLRALESRLGVRLLTRTTRSVAPTAAGQRLLSTAAPRFDEITSELAALRELRDIAAGTIRITTTDYAANTILSPRLANVMAQYPDIKIEISVDYGLSDIVSERFDIGVRWGDQVAKDMIAVRVASDIRLAIVGSPTYPASRGVPREAARSPAAQLHYFATAYARQPVRVGASEGKARAAGARGWTAHLQRRLSDARRCVEWCRSCILA